MNSFIIGKTAGGKTVPVQVDDKGQQLVRAGGFAIPDFDHMALTYFGATNNVASQVFKRGGAAGTTVATLTYTYTGGGAADDDRIASITIS